MSFALQNTYTYFSMMIELHARRANFKLGLYEFFLPSFDLSLIVLEEETFGFLVL